MCEIHVLMPVCINVVDVDLQITARFAIGRLCRTGNSCTGGGASI